MDCSCNCFGVAAASKVPVKRYNLLVPDIFPRAAPPFTPGADPAAERKCKKLLEYLEKNPHRIPKVRPACPAAAMLAGSNGRRRRACASSARPGACALAQRTAGGGPVPGRARPALAGPARCARCAPSLLGLSTDGGRHSGISCCSLAAHLASGSPCCACGRAGRRGGRPQPGPRRAAQASRRLARRLYVELGRGRIGHVQAAARAYRYLLLHLRAPDAALLARELMVEPVVRARPTLVHCYPPARPCRGAPAECRPGVRVLATPRPLTLNHATLPLTACRALRRPWRRPACAPLLAPPVASARARACYRRRLVAPARPRP